MNSKEFEDKINAMIKIVKEVLSYLKKAWNNLINTILRVSKDINRFDMNQAFTYQRNKYLNNHLRTHNRRRSYHNIRHGQIR